MPIVPRLLARNFAALQIRDYRVFAIGQTISVSGTWMQKLAQAWLVLVLTDSGVLLGVTAALQQLPVLFLTTYGGTLADRYSKRTILICTAAAGAVPAVALGVVVQVGQVQVWMVLAAALVQGVVDAIDKPARLTLVNDIAPPAVLTNAIALNAIIQNLGKVVGPAVGGVLIATVGLAPAFFLNAASYGPVLWALLLVRPRRDASTYVGPGSAGSLRSTLGYVRSQPELLTALVLMLVAGTLAYNWETLVPTLIKFSFRGGAGAVGWAFTAMGLGGVLGGVVLAGQVRPAASRLFTIGWAFSAVFLLMAVCPSLAMAQVLMFVLGAVSVVFRASANAVLQVNSDPLMRGRVISLFVLCMNGTTPVGGPLIGWICGTFDPRAACVVAGLTTAVTALACSRYARA